jgi:hypothetical protein
VMKPPTIRPIARIAEKAETTAACLVDKKTTDATFLIRDCKRQSQRDHGKSAGSRNRRDSNLETQPTNGLKMHS